MGEQHLGVAQHREHLQRGDRVVGDAPARGGHGSAEGEASLHRRLHEQAPGQGLIAHGAEGEAHQVGQHAPLDQPSGFTLARVHGSIESAATAHDQTALPDRPEQHQKSQAGER